jgi:hypothetical protein
VPEKVNDRLAEKIIGGSYLVVCRLLPAVMAVYRYPVV